MYMRILAMMLKRRTVCVLSMLYEKLKLNADDQFIILNLIVMYVLSVSLSRREVWIVRLKDMVYCTYVCMCECTVGSCYSEP